MEKYPAVGTGQNDYSVSFMNHHVIYVVVVVVVVTACRTAPDCAALWSVKDALPMSSSSTSGAARVNKRLLAGVIRQTNAHNKQVEERQMWKALEAEKELLRSRDELSSSRRERKRQKR